MKLPYVRPSAAALGLCLLAALQGGNAEVAPRLRARSIHVHAPLSPLAAFVELLREHNANASSSVATTNATRVPVVAAGSSGATAAAVASQDAAATPDFDLSKVEESLAKMTSKGQATPGMVSFVKVTKGMIMDDMKPKVKLAHGKAQGLLDSYSASFGACFKGKKSLASTLETLKGTRRSASEAHRSCRKLEEAAFTTKQQCDDLLTSREESVKAACTAVKDLDRDPNTEADNCHSAHRESYWMWLDRNANWFLRKRDEYKAVTGKCDKAKKEFDDLKPKCDALAGKHAGQKATCDQKQAALEEATCSLGKEMSQACGTYQECYDDTQATYDEEMPGIKKQELDRKGEWRVLMRIECLLDVFADKDGQVDAATIDKCKAKTYDTSHLDLSYPSVPPKKDCPDAPAVPGQNAYKVNEYSTLPKNAPAVPTSLCVVQAGGGAQLGTFKGVDQQRCSMQGDFLQASGGGSCLLSDDSGKPLAVDYTRNVYTTYAFTLKMSGNPANQNRRPAGGFMPCNVDDRSAKRGRSPELNFYDVRGKWGYALVRHPHSYFRHAKPDTYGQAMPDNEKELKWEVTMRWGSDKKLYLYSWKVNGMQMTGYSNFVTNCPANSKSFGFSPRVWAHSSTKMVAIKDFRVFQGLVPFDMPQIVGTGIPKTALRIACAKKGVKYKGAGIPGYGRMQVRNIMNCQKRCAYLSGCAHFTYYPDGWCHYYASGALAVKAKSSNVISGPGSCENPATTGLRADFFYYSKNIPQMPNLMHARPDISRIDSVVWYHSTTANWPGVRRGERFAARWTGSLLIKTSGPYELETESDDGSFLFIDGRLVLDNGGQHGMKTIKRKVDLKAGFHDVMLTMFENGGAAGMKFRYSGPDTGFHRWLVPTEALRPRDADADKTPNGPFGTPDNERFYKPPTKLLQEGDDKYVLFSVRAKNDAHIGLFPRELDGKSSIDTSQPYYEVVLGGWGDTKSCIRRGRSDSCRAHPLTKNIVSKDEFREFWVSYNAKTKMVSVGRGHNIKKHRFMKFQDSSPLEPKGMAVMTGYTSTGEWMFSEPLKEVKKSLSAQTWFLGKQGADCASTCKEQERDCDPNLRSGFSRLAFKAAVKEELGLMCKLDDRKWFGKEQPSFVLGGASDNVGSCLGSLSLPLTVSCTAKDAHVMRWCKCSAAAKPAQVSA